jgi:ferric-dicitrate binding protein FerR (iron transport regulator)
MKNKKIEQWLLLEQSGELSRRKRKQLSRELSSSSDARRLRDELQLLSRSVQIEQAAPSPWMTTRIDAQLRQKHVFSKPWKKPVLALAACLVAAIGFLNFQGRQVISESTVAQVAMIDESDIWDDSIGDELSELEDMMLALSDSPFDIMEM